ncbi:hypothetical protein [Leptothrix discophora]|uniref:Prepilin-type N-terminal cleavage/methylation domain-containing protein n=1 Tax=Leptothrix discophora TaxID=89 RepID=A0ABT9G100_LEPDI|nr:hypothetical protein [Leptothrix discophora]MDP4300071.1 hypothetical protein [Leptothrix discophora]
MAPERRVRPAGIGLVEVLVALLVLSVALGALMRLQTLMETGAELDRQRVEALALAQSLHEDLRAGLSIDATEPGDAAPVSPFLLSHEDRPADPAGMPELRDRRTVLGWTDRLGVAQTLALHTLMNARPAHEARLSALALLARAPAMLDVAGRPLARPRQALIPRSAVPLGDGRSAWQPHKDLPEVWLIDDASGAVVARCGGLTTRPSTVAEASDCVAYGGQLLGGVVRFATDLAHPGPAEAENPLSAALPMGFEMRPATASASAPETRCEHDAPASVPDPAVLSAPGVVRYLCVVATSGTSLTWSGRLEIVPVGWTIGSVDSLPPDAPARRVCRYSADHDHDGRIGNAEHPAIYLAVDGPLGDQNFLVVLAGAECPRDTASGPPGSAAMSWVDHSTVRHQPP